MPRQAPLAYISGSNNEIPRLASAGRGILFSLREVNETLLFTISACSQKHITHL
ncbi:hypothetical protein HMPREF9134_01187 [Porphyromonas catoniae F0037]|uniref:Uncharacterized protein n=1 Tax=Porphyromonas catoniae F0037 TaxID=1127696 RepID=L1NC52_9PORP|nr:hypothetical protein HMPREF9134_01187 [Porphyromonas catoniae F0037]